MENFIRSPEPLKDNNAATWSIWKEEFLIFMGLLGYMERSQSFKANLFKNLVGSIGLATINKLSFERIEDKENLDILLKKLDHYYNPQKTQAEIRYTFFKSAMKVDETIENYIQRLKEQAQDCGFCDKIDTLVRDVVILHTHDKILREKYLKNEHLDCNKIIAIYKNHKSSKTNVKPKDYKEENKNKEVLTKQKESVNVMSMQGTCWRCRTKHPIRQCPAWNYRCTRCNNLHHFEKYCKAVIKNVGENLNMNNLNINSEKHTQEKKPFYNINKNLNNK